MAFQKSVKLIDGAKNDVLHSCKSKKKKNSFDKNFFQLICADKIFKTVCNNLLKIFLQLLLYSGLPVCPFLSFTVILTMDFNL